MPDVVIVSVTIVVVPLTSRALSLPVKTTSSAAPFPKTALPVIVNAKAPPSVPWVVIVEPFNVLFAPDKVTAPV